jgi:hypothetical protein
MEYVYANGMTEPEANALINEDLSDPLYCSATIKLLNGYLAMEGPTGEALRYELVQGALTATP